MTRPQLRLGDEASYDSPIRGIRSRILERQKLVLGAVVVFFVFLVAIISHPMAQTSSFNNASQALKNLTTSMSMLGHQTAPEAANERPVRILFVESKGAHDEVLAAWKEAWGAMPNAELHTFQWKTDKFGSKDLEAALPIRAAVNNPSLSITLASDWSKFYAPPDILVSTTCEAFPFWLTKQLLNASTTHIFCTAHRTDSWHRNNEHLEELLSPWIHANRLTIITLSEHVSTALSQKLQDWTVVQEGVAPRLEVLPPVFSVPVAERDTNHEDISFAIQGYINFSRRNYGAMFDAVTRAKAFLAENSTSTSTTANSTTPQIRLHLVGHVDNTPTIPPEVKDNVIIDHDLLYLDFYALLSRMTALIPAFSDDSYLINKASSSVPASLIAGIPIVAPAELLNAYTYLTPDAVWQQQQGETDAEVLVEIVKQSAEVRLARVNAARVAARQAITNNQAAVIAWTLERLGEAPLVKEDLERQGAWVEWEEGVAWWEPGYSYPHFWWRD